MKIVKVNLPVRCDCGLCSERAVLAAEFDNTGKDKRFNMCAKCAEDMFIALGEELGIIDCAIGAECRKDNAARQSGDAVAQTGNGGAQTGDIDGNKESGRNV
ncbi:MAG: hypothetical protein HFH71_06275 [Clostridia bacterium]|nr:hypothetical protein [Clostridia bacterium]